MPRAQASPKAAPVLRHIPSVRPGIEGGSAWFLLGIYVRMVELGLQEGNRGRIPAVTVQCNSVKTVCRRGVCGIFIQHTTYNIHSLISCVSSAQGCQRTLLRH